MAHAIAVPSTHRPRPALRLVKTTELSRDEWLDVRKNGIGSSDAASAVGLNPYKSALQLWLEKTSRDLLADSMEDKDESSPAYWGTLLEPIVAAHYTRRTGNKVRKVNAVLQHPDHPWMLANIDREIVGSSDVQILECKTAGINGARLWKDGVPEYVQLQVMHQLAVTGKKAADVAVLIGGQDLQIHRIQRDEAVIERLIALEQVFWNYVQTDAAPPVDGSDSADMALRSLYPQDLGEVLDLTNDLEMSAVFSDWKDVRHKLETFHQQEALLKQRIQQRMGSATKAVFESDEVTWKRSKDSVGWDTTKLFREHPDLLKQYQVTRPGSRRFVLQE